MSEEPKITLTHEMNETAKKLLRIGSSDLDHYVLAMIEDMERRLQENDAPMTIEAVRGGAAPPRGLRPCPFCGGEATPWETEHGVVSVVECKTCRTRFVFPYDRKGNDLFEFWNARAQEGKTDG